MIWTELLLMMKILMVIMFLLSYSRLMLDDIINAAYGEDRFNINIIDKQIYYGDNDSILVNVDIAKN